MSAPTPPTPPNPPTNFHELLDAYFDGTLSPADLARFDEALLTDASLREAVALQREIDASLARLYTYPGMRELPAPVPVTETTSTTTNPAIPGSWLLKRSTWLGAIAASLLAAAVFVYWPRAEFTLIPAERVYQRTLATGWNPAFICETDEEFVRVVAERFGQGLLIPSATTGVVLNGWAYSDDYAGSPISPQTMILMAHAEGQPVMVLMDTARNDRTVTVPPESGLQVFRRRVGRLVLYELTPLDRAIVIEAARLVD
jgi:hypothetical protein